ncbi:DinB family protein [Spirillospora sp. NBC_00431]
MTSAQLLTDAFDRIRQQVHRTVGGLTPAQLAYRVDPGANSIAWLVWHLTRVQDDHISDVAGTAQAWTDGGWADRFGLPLDPSDTGYGHSSDQVAAVQVDSPDLLIGYYDAAHAATAEYVGSVTDADLGRIVDRSWNPPVTLGVRLVSVVSDCTEHVGQAAFVRGVLQRA